MSSDTLPPEWQNFLISAGFESSLWEKPAQIVAARRRKKTVFPPEKMLFRAFEMTPVQQLRVVLLGQDPYHNEDQAEGLAFSVPESVVLPPSLRNIFREFADDLGVSAPESGHLGAWASHGVLLMNSILSVDAHSPGSHKNYGWENFTDAVIAALSMHKENLVFLLWGNFARKKAALIDDRKHLILESNHPSPLSAYRGFFGSKPFSRTEKYLGNWKWPKR